MSTVVCTYALLHRLNTAVSCWEDARDGAPRGTACATYSRIQMNIRHKFLFVPLMHRVV